MEFVPFAVFVVLNKKITDFIKELLPNSISNKAVQGIAWAVAIGLTLLFAVSDFGSSITVIEGKNLDQLDLWAQIIYGLAAGAGAGVLNDVIERRNPDSNPDPGIVEVKPQG